MIEVNAWLGCLVDNGFFEIHDDSDPADILYIVTNDNRHYLNNLTLVEYMDTIGHVKQFMPSNNSIDKGFIISDYFINELISEGKFKFETEDEAFYFKLKFCS